MILNFEIKKTSLKGRGLFAIKNIKKGEEITVNYNGEPDDETPIDWFS
ncbi:MAG: SET domain-containing protein-lysine N-methyltransferase [Patescibacteria group bacterium]